MGSGSARPDGSAHGREATPGAGRPRVRAAGAAVLGVLFEAAGWDGRVLARAKRGAARALAVAIMVAGLPVGSWMRSGSAEADPARAWAAALGALSLALLVVALRRPPSVGAVLLWSALSGIGWASLVVAAALLVAIVLGGFGVEGGPGLFVGAMIAAPWAVALGASARAGRKARPDSDVPAHLGLALGAIGLFAWETIVGPEPSSILTIVLEVAFALGLTTAGVILGTRRAP